MAEKRIEVAEEGALKDGEMKQVSAEEVEILLSRVDGEYHAVSAECTHLGAPLEQGVRCGRHVICPWHHARFRVDTGAHVEAPGSDDLCRFPVEVENGKVYVRLPDDIQDRQVPDMAAADPQKDGRCFVVLGGGAAGGACAEALRQQGFRGRIVMVTAEARPPYDRTALSKAFLADDDEALFTIRDASFLEEAGIELQTGRCAESIDVADSRVVFREGDPLAFDALMVATGSAPRRLDVPGADAAAVYTVRTPEDAQAIRKAAAGARRAVVVGASFIAMECAASLRSRGLEVTVVAPEAVPFEAKLGREVGGVLHGMHEAEGVRFELESQVAGIDRRNGTTFVSTAGGKELEADLVVVGIGVQPRTGVFADRHLDANGGVRVDRRLRVTDLETPVYAAGDIASFPYGSDGTRVRIEHWRTARQQGRVAGTNMAGADEAFDRVPFFWTRQFGESLQYVGHAASWDDVIVEGKPEEKDFIAYYVRSDRVDAVAAMGRTKQTGAIEWCMQAGEMPPASEVRQGDVDWLERAASLDLCRS